MTTDLGALLPAVEASAKELGLVLFYGLSRIASPATFVEWDSDRHSDYREFLNTAIVCGVKMICIHDYKFEAEELEEAFQTVKEAELSTQERRALDKQLNALRMYVGFTCGLELAFDYRDQVYFFHLRTPWRTEFIDAINELDESIFDSEMGDPDEPMGGSGFFSRN